VGSGRPERQDQALATLPLVWLRGGSDHVEDRDRSPEMGLDSQAQAIPGLELLDAVVLRVEVLLRIAELDLDLLDKAAGKRDQAGRASSSLF
jgi:hypothetical protein